MHGSSPGEVPIPVTTIGGLVTLANPDSLPVGASPRNYDWDYLVGGGQTRPGLTSVYSSVDTTIGPNSPTAAASTTWSDPSNILVADGKYTSFAPANASNSIQATGFGFQIPSTSSVTGIIVEVTGFSSSPATLNAQLLVNGAPVGNVKTAPFPGYNSVVTFGSSSDGWSAFLTSSQANLVNTGIQLWVTSSGFDGATAFLDYVSMSLALNTGTSNFQFITTFTDQAGNVKNISVDADGNMWMENVTTSPGTLSLIFTNIIQNASVVGSSSPGVQYLAFGNGKSGADMPLKYTQNGISRITQVGPGAAPVFTPIQASSTNYSVASISQPAQMSDPDDPGHLQAVLQSLGPTSTAPGNVVTIFYSNQFVNSQPDNDLVNAFNSGLPVYVYMSALPAPFVNGVYQVTSVGAAIPPGAEYARWYFTFNVSSTAYNFIGGPDTATGYYNRTEATVVTTTPVPNVTVGSQITISGCSVTGWNSAWTVTETPNSSTMAITGSEVNASGVATLNYAVTGASSAPVAGQIVTISNTLNANGALNTTATIQTATGGTTGSFTINVSVTNYAFEAESGYASTAGTIFNIDPGAAVVGTDTNVIYGNVTGSGTLVFNATGQFIDPGTYQGTCGFITADGLWTFPAPPTTFTVPDNTTSLQVSALALGPPNVVGRYIAITEAGQNGVPGGNFFVLPASVTYYYLNQKYTATATVVNDNATESVNLFFTGSILNSAESIDSYGYNLFNCIEIGDPQWTVNYAGRQAFGGCLNKVQNFVNLSFDGGYLSGSQLTPLGWSKPDTYTTLIPSPKFGNSLYIKNTFGTAITCGAITQKAYQDANGVAIIEANTTYSVRVSCSSSVVGSGTLTIALVTTQGVVLGQFTVPVTSMTTNLQYYSGSLLSTKQAVIPSDLTLQVYVADLASGADVLIDRIDIYPTEIPVLATTAYFSYAGLFEQIDSVTGGVVFESENQQPVNGAMVLYDTFYAMKGWTGSAPGSSLYSLQKSSNLEPAQWNEPEVAQRSGGAVGPHAFAVGEQWFLGASRNGLYLFVGGQPGKISQEIFQVWDAINWQAAQSIWVQVDLDARRIYIGVPMTTPNFWLPNAAANLNPTSPNVILMCDFKGLDSGEELKAYPQMHTTMFGTLNAIDMRRKWSIWQIPSPYANFVQGSTDVEFYICNGRGTSKVYFLDPTANSDDGILIDSLYTTAGLPGLSKRSEMPQLGRNRVRMKYMVATLQSSGVIQCTLYANRLPGAFIPPGNTQSGPGLAPDINALLPAPTIASWQVPGGIVSGTPYNDDSEVALNFAATRTFVEFRQYQGGSGFSLTNLVLYGTKDAWNQMRGRIGP